jgi:hypothetical protein
VETRTGLFRHVGIGDFHMDGVIDSDAIMKTRGVNSNLPLADVKTMESISRSSLARTSLALVLLAIASGMFLLVGVVGIYGVISYTVSE